MRNEILVGLCVFTTLASASASQLPISLDERVRTSAAVFRGTVESVHSYVSPSDGFIYTQTGFRVDETFKGKLPHTVQLVHRGGEVGNHGEANDLAPQFKIGEERLIFVGRRSDGSLFAQRGDAGAIEISFVRAGHLQPSLSAGKVLGQLRAMTGGGSLPGEDLTDQAGSAKGAMPVNASPLNASGSSATNLMVDNNGIPARFCQPDRGEGIPCWVDADYLPSGISITQALNAVQSALAAWTNVTSLRYQFMGVQSFGEAAGDVPISDGRLLIQLHDHYNSITRNGGDALGVGGHGWVIGNTPSGWTTGGNVMGNDFHKVTGGTVVIQHTNSFFTGNPANLAEVLCHEIGHTIGLGHSSEDPNEPDPSLAQATMYYLVHGNGRGSALSQWDINVVRQVHPPTNTPPWCYDRVLDAIHSPVPFTTPGVNSAEIRGYDLQPEPLTFMMADSSSMNGNFSATTNGVIRYLTHAWYGNDSERIDPAGNSFWDMTYARWSDGRNASPYAVLKVISLLSDYYGEGVPDSWRLTYFGSANPSAGPNRHATNDFDGDGFNNITEFRLGSNPTNKNSNLQLSLSSANLQWAAKGYEAYELSASTDLHNWTRWGNAITPTNFVPGTNIFNLTNSVGVVPGVNDGGPQTFFRLFKVP